MRKTLYQHQESALNKSLSTNRLNDQVAFSNIKSLYNYASLKEPSMLVAKSPYQANLMINLLMIDYDYWFTEFSNGNIPDDLDKFNDARRRVKLSRLTTYAVAHYDTCNIEQFDYLYNLDSDKRLSNAKAFKINECLREISNHCGGYYPFDDVVIITEKPTSIHTDNNLLHNDSGAAVEYSDGFEVYAIEGVPVTKQIVCDPTSITIDQIHKELDIEVQRIMISQYGVSKYLFDTGSQVLDVDVLMLEGSSIRTLIIDSLGNKWLIGSDGSTGRVYHMSVPDESISCSHAHRLISGITDSESRIISES